VPRMGWASRMIMCDEEVNMSDEDGTGDDVNWEDGNHFVKLVETVNESMALGLSRNGDRSRKPSTRFHEPIHRNFAPHEEV
jgi:hypothetical protein